MWRRPVTHGLERRDCRVSAGHGRRADPRLAIAGPARRKLAKARSCDLSRRRLTKDFGMIRLTIAE
jgi:hypothetical protein